MSLRYSILGLLASQPATGYELAQKFDSSLRTAWHATHSQIYPELAKLADAGLVEVVEEGPRNSRTWALTKAGHADLEHWLTEVEPNRSIRNESAVRSFLVMLLEPDQRRKALERDLEHIEGEIRGLQELAAHLDDLPEPSRFRPVVDLGLRMNPVIAEWLRDQIDATSTE